MESELQIALRVRSLLNHGLADLPKGCTDRLHAARRSALSRARTDDVRRPAGTEVLSLELPRFGSRPAALLGVTLVVLVTLAISSWNRYLRSEEYTAIDTELLGDELPIDAYADPGFFEWLQQSPPAAAQPHSPDSSPAAS